MFRKIIKTVFLAALFFWLAVPAAAQNNDVNLYFFWSKACPHCAKEAAFLEQIQPQYSYLKIHEFEIGRSRENALLLQKLGRELKIDTNGVPMTFIGNEYFVGYQSDQITGKMITSLIERFGTQGDPDIVGDLIHSDKNPVEPSATPAPTDIAQQPEKKIPTSTLFKDKSTVNLPDELNVPIIGAVKISNLSLPVLTFTIALVDGFNPCAMWVLLFLISLLLGMKDRKKMWILGSVFIITSGFVYFLFLSAWLNMFLFLGFVTWVRIAVGLVALAMGVYQLRDYWVNREGGCKVVASEKRKKVFEKIREITNRKQFIVALFGMIVLAFAVNLVELVCSAGLPAIYTQVLSLTAMPKWQYYLYLVFYIVVFMIDDLFVFFVAMTTLRAIGIESKYARYSRLIGGIVILAIGILMLVKPEILMFA